MNFFLKKEKVSLIIIFSILIIVSVPNFILSLLRARDQVRRDDMGVLEDSLSQYYEEFGSFPLSSTDGQIMDCLKPGDAPYQNDKGIWIIDAIACVWGKDALKNLITGRTYMTTLPRDPHGDKGVSYLYLSDGERYQLYGAMEGEKEDEVNPKIISKNLHCGNKICNIGRFYNCDIVKTIDECAREEAAMMQ
jgi:type II secretory pathway pseudopilin PulG